MGGGGEAGRGGEGKGSPCAAAEPALGGGREGEKERGRGGKKGRPPAPLHVRKIHFPSRCPAPTFRAPGTVPGLPHRSTAIPHGPARPGLTGIILGPNRMGAAGAGPAARSGRPATREAEGLRCRRDAR